MKKVALYTLGCKLNYVETSAIGDSFTKRGFEISDFNSPADVYVINTCTVTENADRECRQIVRRALRNNPKGFIIVTGCYSQLRPEEIQHIEGVDLILGSQEKFEIFNFIDSFEKKDLACIFTTPSEFLHDFGSAYSVSADDRTRAFLKVQDGCDYKCSFCTIPKARGESRSQSIDSVVEQFNNLLSHDFKEIVLTGVNVGDYGAKIETDLYTLLKRLLEVEGDYRIRISSIEPNLLSDEIIELVSVEERLCKHFHIPLQSGSDRILKLMQRRYLSDLYAERIEKVKKLIPDCGIGVDVIVGFPGETLEDFETTHNFISSLPVSYLHVFTYSERPNTLALKLPNPVPMNERKRRTNILRMLSAKKKHSFYTYMLNKRYRVLFEHNEEDRSIKGFTTNYVRVLHKTNINIENQFVDFEIKDAYNEYCVGDAILNLN